MKLYSDEESDYICRDSRAVPLALRDQVFNLIMDEDHVSLFNPLGYQKRTYHTPTNVNLYSEAVSLQMGIEPAGFINEYNKRYDVWYKAMQDREDRAKSESGIGRMFGSVEEETYEGPNVDYAFYHTTGRLQKNQSERTERTKRDMEYQQQYLQKNFSAIGERLNRSSESALARYKNIRDERARVNSPRQQRLINTIKADQALPLFIPADY